MAMHSNGTLRKSECSCNLAKYYSSTRFEVINPDNILSWIAPNKYVWE